MSFEKNLKNHLQAGCSGLSVMTHEIQRTARIIGSVADKLDRDAHYWSASVGWKTRDTAEFADPIQELEGEEFQNPAAAIKATMNDEIAPSVFIFQDMHLIMGERDMQLVDLIRQAVTHARINKKALIFIGCDQRIPLELEKEIAVLELNLPNREELSVLIGQSIEAMSAAMKAHEPKKKKGVKVKKTEIEQQAEASAEPSEDPDSTVEMVVEAATGMTESEVETALALSMVEKKKISAEIVLREKIASVKKSGILDLMTASESLSDVGGLDLLKNWLLNRADSFSPEAREFGLPAPKGILIVGIPGTGKSLTAKATANILGRPLIRLDVGKVFGGIVGQSEANMRGVIKMAEAVAPVVLFIDEFKVILRLVTSLFAGNSEYLDVPDLG